MEQQKKLDIALMKYSAIAPVISGLPAQYQSFSEYFREVSEKGILHPDGSLRHYATSTIAKWYELYVKNGFDSLQPSGRSDEGKPRKDEGRNYISEKLTGAGGTPDIFEENAVEAVLNAADGTPRMINKLCTASMLVAASRELNSINADAVMQAVSDCELG